MSLQQLYLALLIGGLVLLASIVGTRVASRVGFPSLLLFLLVGVVLGEDGLGLRFDDAELARNIGTAALAVILVEGGLTTWFTDIRKVLAPAAALATIGVVISTVVTAAGAHLLLRIDWQLALLLGAIVSSTDAAAVFSVLRVLPLPRVLPVCLRPSPDSTMRPLRFSYSCSVWCPSCSSQRVRSPFWYTNSLAAPRSGWPSGVSVLSHCAASRCRHPACTRSQLSGWRWSRSPPPVALMPAVSSPLLAAVVLANSGLPHRSATRSFAEGVGWLAQIGLFVLLGLLVNPSELAGDVVAAIVVGLVLLLVARPLSVVGSLGWFRIPWREQVFLSWAGLRGAVPIVLATFPIVAGVADSYRLLNIVFMLVVVFTLVQGPSLRPIARWLGLISREATREIQVEVAPLDMLDAELLTMTVQPPSRLHNVTILELRLPEPAVITLIIRDGRTFVPIPDTRIETGDELLIVTTSKTRAAAESRLRAVSRRGKLAHWFDEYGEVD